MQSRATEGTLEPQDRSGNQPAAAVLEGAQVWEGGQEEGRGEAEPLVCICDPVATHALRTFAYSMRQILISCAIICVYDLIGGSQLRSGDG